MKSSRPKAAEVEVRRNNRLCQAPARLGSEEPFPSVSLTLRTPVLPPLPLQIRRLLKDTYAANGGPERMTLDEWRAAERQIKERIENERPKSRQSSCQVRYEK